MYLKEGLAAIRPSEDEIKQLTALSGRLFIYAVTAVRYIIPQTASVNSRARLETMLEINSNAVKKNSGIDALYSAILSGAVGNDELESHERNNILSVVWAVVCSGGPVSLDGLAIIAELNDESAALAALAPLRSVLHVSLTDDTISTFHASFSQFILDRSRSNDFFCDWETIRQRSFLRCLKVINTQLASSLERNIAISPYLAYAAVDGFGHIGSWHNPGSDELLGELGFFFEDRFEDWTQLVANRGHSFINTSTKSMRMLRGWLKRVGAPKELPQAALNADIYLSSNQAGRDLIRDEATRNQLDLLDGITGLYSRTSWIWGEISHELERRASRM
ncbi:unnamed protein product [Rhizoctonia solani]|uniref:Uncharacterized protein n=1 Tax=Rhizoctonia solani TaxID=456999 RepID=A0A8H3HDG1_9AGAM|nr:unnamed protein product [Rhizoctonia solani]